MSHLEFAMEAGEDFERDVNSAGPTEALNCYFLPSPWGLVLLQLLGIGEVGLGYANKRFDFSFISSIDVHTIYANVNYVSTELRCGLQFVELPAGMVKRRSFRGAAADEIEEELHLTTPEDELMNMSELAPRAKVGPRGQSAEGDGPFRWGCDGFIPMHLHGPGKL
jgi:hypothetical protein